MSLTDDYGQGVTFLGYGDKPDLTVLGDGIVNGVLRHSVLTFASQAARDAALTGSLAPTAGMLSWLISEGRLDCYDGSAWNALTPGSWTPITPAAGISAHSGNPAWRIVNGTVELRGTLQMADGSAFPQASPLVLTTLPGAAAPTTYRYFVSPTTWASSFMFARVEAQPGGNVVATLPSGNTGCTWIGLDGCRFSP